MTELSDIEIATQKKYRFDMPGFGAVSTEDLFDLPLDKPARKSQRVLPNLEDIAIELDMKLQTSTKTFVKKRTVINNVDARKLRIVVRVIEIKQAEIEAKEKAAFKSSEKARLVDLYESKKIEVDGKKSLDEIKAMIEAL